MTPLLNNSVDLGGSGKAQDRSLAPVLVLAPSGRDGALAKRILGGAGLSIETCADMESLCRKVDPRTGAMLLTEEALSPSALQRLAVTLGQQPPWSDVPLVIVTGKTGSARCRHRTLQFLEPLRNVTFLERPVRIMTLVSTLRAALDSRSRQQEIGELCQRLERGVRQRDEFLAMLAHELRNPLAPIRNAAEVLKRVTSEAEIRWAQEVVQRQVQHLMHLVDDLLEVSRVQRGKITLQKGRIDLCVVVARAIETVRPLIDARSQELIVTCPSQPVWLDGDLNRLIQVAVNILENAARYTPERGRIWLSVQQDEQEACLRVRDEGIGMHAEMLPRVFDPFTQGEQPLDRSQGGLGIGLTLVRHLVELHSGSVQAFSAGVGLGSEFVVRLPAAQAGLNGDAGARERGTIDPSRLRILIVDDNTDAADSMAVLLRLQGHDVRTAYNGSAGLDTARSFRPQVALLDIGLPQMDGYEVARRLRQDPESWNMLLVAVTGYGQEEARARGRAAGFDAYMVKPADLEELQRLLRCAEVKR